MKILIFKTDIKTSIDFMYIRPYLDKDKAILDWTIDLEDCDSVLRIECNSSLTEKDIEKRMQDIRVFCEALPE